MSLIVVPEQRFDLGVLFVHGIGQNKQGETLLSFGEPLCRSLDELVEPPPGGATSATGLTQVTTAWLSTPDEGPARAEVTVEGASAQTAGAVTSRWLFAEAWWAATFPTPTYAELAIWSFGVLPATLVSHFDRRFRRAGFALARSFHEFEAYRDVLLALIKLMAEALLVAVALTLMPLLLVFLAMIMVVGALPFKTMRELAASAQRVLAATVGDSYVFMHQRFTRATICARVRQQLEWLATRCRRIAVVAHSQGAAVAHRVLHDKVTAPCDLLITFGSGLSKLAEIERGDTSKAQAAMIGAVAFCAAAVAGVAWIFGKAWNDSPGAWGLGNGAFDVFYLVEFAAFGLLLDARRGIKAGEVARGKEPEPLATEARSAWLGPLAFVLVTGFIFFLMAWQAYRSLSEAAWESAPQWLTLVGLGGAYAALTMWRRTTRRSADFAEQGKIDRSLYLEHFELRNRTDIRWYDLYATADPVPNGRLLDELEPTGLFSDEVTNTDSLVFDHTSYWQSGDDFVQQVARRLLGLSGIRMRNLNGQAPRRRRWRAQWLAASRWILVIAAIVIAADWLVHAPGWQFLLRQLLLPADATATTAGHWAGLFPIATAFAMWAVFRAELAWHWREWQREEQSRFLTARPFTLAPGEFWMLLLPPAAMTAAALYVIGGPNLLAAGAMALLLALILSRRRVLLDFLHRTSRSGSAEYLRRLDIEALVARRDRADRDGNAQALINAGGRLRWFDPALAQPALYRAAHEFKQANAAWLLGGLHENLARHARDEQERTRQRELALRAYARGARLWDPLSARWASYMARDLRRPAAERVYLRRAYRAGDPSAAHSVGLYLIKTRDEAERARGLAVYEEGVRRGDALSALFLAGHVAGKAEKAPQPEAGQLRSRAISLYRTAFDLGHVAAATEAGNLLRLQRDLAAARRAYGLGIRMRNAEAALRLGRLEEEDEQDNEAALAAYETAVRIDENGGATAEAYLRAGRLLERLGRTDAAANRFRLALDAADGSKPRVSAWSAAEAGVALAANLERKDRYPHRKEAHKALRRATELEPRIGAQPFVEFLGRWPAVSDEYENDVRSLLAEPRLSALGAKGLVTLAKLVHGIEPDRERAILERAWSLRVGYAPGIEAAAAALYVYLRRNNEAQGAKQILDTVVAEHKSQVEGIAKELEDRFERTAARELRERVKSNP